jgi:pre-mRNA-splicing factor SPF27
MSQPLALDTAPAGDAASGWRRDGGGGGAAVDALPYVDPLTDAERARAERLVAAEVRKSGGDGGGGGEQMWAAPADRRPPPSSQLASSTRTPADYLAALPPAPASTLPPLAAGEVARAAAGAPPLPPLDTTRFRLDPPPAGRRGDPGAWRGALDNARAQLEHQHNR